MRGVLTRGPESSSPCYQWPRHLQQTTANLGLWHKTGEEEVKRGNLLLETRTCGYVTADCGLTWIKVSFMHTWISAFCVFFFFVLPLLLSVCVRFNLCNHVYRKLLSSSWRRYVGLFSFQDGTCFLFSSKFARPNRSSSVNGGRSTARKLFNVIRLKSAVGNAYLWIRESRVWTDMDKGQFYTCLNFCLLRFFLFLLPLLLSVQFWGTGLKHGTNGSKNQFD